MRAGWRLSRGPSGAGRIRGQPESLLGSHAGQRGRCGLGGHRAAGGQGKPGVWPGRTAEHQPINLRSPGETLRGFAFCLANYSASPLFLSWGARALCGALIKRKPLSQLPQGWGNQWKPRGSPSGVSRVWGVFPGPGIITDGESEALEGPTRVGSPGLVDHGPPGPSEL